MCQYLPVRRPGKMRISTHGKFQISRKKSRGGFGCRSVPGERRVVSAAMECRSRETIGASIGRGHAWPQAAQAGAWLHEACCRPAVRSVARVYATDDAPGREMRPEHQTDDVRAATPWCGMHRPSNKSVFLGRLLRVASVRLTAGLFPAADPPHGAYVGEAVAVVLPPVQFAPFGRCRRVMVIDGSIGGGGAVFHDGPPGRIR